ncbi:hypothetical protein [Natrialbaceae archaeon AArc-T1-2]|uniref:hypothetical protein n=1 Tax=Natrialbaceae archaeon AArc-T1-2 TaxID=3053904 RepID=UPI00255AC832|nr:hypothetical protein [Natrialbaceae archaeon AArc-T1-2]WIV67801.1 hypothetical protein QQ977_03460 [Natrialbaceae archaeon AArc-T1-2]
MTPRGKSAILWGIVGALSFLVLVQGYALFAGPLVSIGQAGAVAVLVAVGTGVSAYALEYRIATWAARRADDE